MYFSVLLRITLCIDLINKTSFSFPGIIVRENNTHKYIHTQTYTHTYTHTGGTIFRSDKSQNMEFLGEKNLLNILPLITVVVDCYVVFLN